MSRSIPQINSDKPLGGRYKVVNQLGVGGFGRTFLAEDLHLPGHPRCVVKQLKPQFRSDDTLQMARRCFNTEAEVLYQLGNHSQIPRLLAHFEDNQEFYLAQEFIEGVPLTQELNEGRPWSEAQTVKFLKDVLDVLVFVHQQQVIHRDLKPSNLIRRFADGKVVVIDFGAVKQVSTQNYDVDTGVTNLTISIGTQGYMPNEQLAGKPRFSSDIYAVGVIGVQALTGVHPKYLGDDEKGEIAWHHRATHVGAELRNVIDRMVRYDFRDRYPTALEALMALEALAPVSDAIPPAIPLPKLNEVSPSQPNRINDLSHPPPLSISSDFNTTDLTVAGEESMSTAIWLDPDASQPPAVPVNPSKGGSNWLTHAVGRPYPDTGAPDGSTPAAPAKPWFKRLMKPLSAAAAIAILGTGAVALQVGIPQIDGFLTDRDGSAPPASPTPSPLSTLSLSSTDATRLLQYANNLMQEKNFKTALTYYDRVLELKSDSAEAYAGRCETLNQLGRPEEAVVSCNDALAYQPDYMEALWSKGNALLLQGQTYEALKIYEDVTYFKPELAMGWVRRGVALQKLGRSAEAVYALDQAISLQRNIAEAWKTKGEALLNLQRYGEAVVALDKALQLQNPDDPETMRLRDRANAALEQ